jgi:peroxiredoxin
MIWIRFDEEDRRTSAPHFCLDSILGEQVCLQDQYEEYNLVLVFTHGLGCQECQSTIRALLERDIEYREQASKALIIIPDDRHMGGQLEKDLFLHGLPEETLARMLLDPNGHTRREYTNLISASLVGDEDQIIFVLDTYGAPYTAVIDRELDSREVYDEILNWLQYINIQCPE